jgi:peptidoglycan/LPS O-acetylase OafA/YrhL
VSAFARSGFVLPPGVFRLVLALAVVASHVTRLDIGRLAVLAFFFLSGFWSSRIWAQKFGSGAAMRFYAARWLRIAPLYLVVLLTWTAIRATPLHFENFTLFGIATTYRDPLYVSWSLDIELQFYLLLPLLFGVVAEASAGLTILAALVIGAAGCWLVQTTGVVTVAKYLPLFALGALTDLKGWRPGPRTAAVSLAGFAVMSAATLLTPFWTKNVGDPFDRDIWAFFWLLPLVPWMARMLTVRSSRLDRHLGNLSYPLYLVHLPAIMFMTHAFSVAIPIRLAGVGLALVVAVVVYVLVDRPLDRWRVRLTEARAPQPEARVRGPEAAQPAGGDS